MARLATGVAHAGIPIRPRFHTLVAGTSGSGKSHLARTLGSHIGVPTLVINVSSWSVLSSRNEPWTFSTICNWLLGLRSGGVLVLDELDKLGSSCGNDWLEHIKLEIHDVLDQTIPWSAKMPSFPDAGSEDMPDAMRDLLTRRLKRVFVIGCGAWQHAWRSKSGMIGFGQTSCEPELPSQEQILGSISAELRQRFRNEVCWLPPMTRTDYQSVSDRIARKIQDPEMRITWNRLAAPLMMSAIENGLGMRVFEEIMLETLLALPAPAPVIEVEDSSGWLI